MAQAFAEYKTYPVKPGWYCLGFDRLDDQVQADIGPTMEDIYRFDGQDWYDEHGEKKEGTFDPELGIEVGMTGADYYVPN
ncbi:hypothetical protein [Alicycliphilus denitrificans]|uniref:hypothetical protein n=1 Tax=Alicycliphilus denitrificans TaxID=179636 RepID=UPI0001D9E93D|nr:hypothetical protein [Alicycliphilus denitrificans]ADV02190.1 hypothetical protein Alide_4588 [Alicycliphilus denitrificans BC]